ncbi:hypothetical protein EGM88_06475 [Aureibaculum marinum]|uniref:DUF5683 domain-containing protein n=1 Tax=Aureibaculum marinum TaxID=2487930 RepID=A0A3N4P510_9FLAO|nr:DUF5683 domain-containing protein [Aureibaculum marinum]RPD98829.1 hypothetical protein EGM88_06475 [Aureibaculum marinum]
MIKWWVFILFLMGSFASVFAQEIPADLKVSKVDTTFVEDEINILAPSKAAFYSAVFPGLGQIYNKKYWKTPIVWGAIGTGVYFYVDNNNKYNRYRDAFKLELTGRPHEFDGTGENPQLTQASLERAQTFYKKNRDLSLFITIGIYILNIIEANVDAHLPDKALNTNISFNPTIFNMPVTSQAAFGATVSFNF